jgi:HEAT repeat protein
MMKNTLLVLLIPAAFIFGCNKNLDEEQYPDKPQKQDTEAMASKPTVLEADRLIEEFSDRDTTEESFEELLRILSSTGDTDDESLIESLRNEDWRERYLASRALGWLNWKAKRVSPPLAEDTRVVEALIEALKDEERRVRRNICWAFAKIKDERATEPLVEILKNDKDPDVRSEAAWALG